MKLSLKEHDRIFFPTSGKSIEPAREICNACSIKPDCLAYAIETNQIWGVWAGEGQRGLRRLSKQHKARMANAQRSSR